MLLHIENHAISKKAWLIPLIPISIRSPEKHWPTPAGVPLKIKNTCLMEGNIWPVKTGFLDHIFLGHSIHGDGSSHKYSDQVKYPVFKSSPQT